jgi:hypothetical protein
MLQCASVADRVQRQHRDRALSGVRNPSTHSIVVVLPGAVGTDQPEDLALLHVERDIVEGDREP